ncbi:MAG: elongation factor 4 [Candidatus Zambryskibacteria bacterium CG11_big_fil_rev_8_21_14_0_20_42_18]|nr:MAG: elongation factor 4 [Candidatus Zambryskibacteria bacterium CG11_big_fil_rev_8_21_14_0_20_42_18]
MDKIRNFSIIAHIDHGKSTLADRMLELTGTIEKRHMRDQVLDSMDLERERGITIKMQPVRMRYGEYIFNLIDTPGHIDFSYEVSRALRAVEGSILLVDATQGVQAQTLTTLNQAREAGLTIIPVVSKIDSPLARTDEVSDELVQLLSVGKEDILLVSGKTGVGVQALLDAIVERISPPTNPNIDVFRSLIFDFKYSNHRGVIVFIRVFSGKIKKGEKLKFKVAGREFQALEVGVFIPEEKSVDSLESGEIGYIVTGIKEPGVASVGDTVASINDTSPALTGYEKARPVVWASIYPESQDDFTLLRQALLKLSLSDSAFSFEEESSSVLGRGFRAGFLGMLHLEIITERLHREFNLPLIITLPSIIYKVIYKSNAEAGLAGKEKTIYTPSFFPEDHLIDTVLEPWASVVVIVSPEYTSAVVKLLYEFEAELNDTESVGTMRTALNFDMPLRELMRGFFDKLKSVTSGFGSISYTLSGEKYAKVCRLDILIADEVVPAFAKVISRLQIESEAELAVEKLVKALPRQMFTTKIQAKALGRIIASRTLSGMKKDVTQHMYGGDITRKMKLREKQKKGKKKMKERGRVNIPQDVFLKMIRRD